MIQDDLLDELEINVRPAGELAGRLVLLAAVLRRLALESANPAEIDEEDDDEGEDLPALDDREHDRFDLLHWLADERLAGSLTVHERQLLGTPVEQLQTAVVVEASLAASESLAAIAWVAGIGDLPGDPTAPADPAPLLARIPGPWDGVRDFITQLRPASDEEAAGEREAAELWFWRLTVEDERRAATGRERRALDEVIRDAALEAADAGYWRTVNDDVLLGDGPVSEAPRDLLDVAADLARARLHAMNWACGYGDRWDTVPLDL